MAVKVRLTGDLRRYAGADAIEVVGGETVGAVFAEVARRHPKLGDQLFDDKGRLHYAVTIMKGSRRIVWPQDREERIEDGAELLLTRFHSGG